MRSRFAIVLLLLLAGLVPLGHADGLEGCEEHVRFGAPSYDPVLLCRVGYALSYNAQRKVPDWVAYHLTPEKVSAQLNRTDDFRADSDLPEGERAELTDYRGSDYDMGHMAPAAAMRWSRMAMSESFLLSNMASQVGAGFNRGIWRALEARVRKWVLKRGDLYVVTGPIYGSKFLKYIGSNKVAVPTAFYKVVFDPARNEAIALILPNESRPTKELASFIFSVDEVETQTGLDFLPDLDDAVEDGIESVRQEHSW